MSRLVNTLIKARDPNAELESDIKEMLTEAALVEEGVTSEAEHLDLTLDIEDLDPASDLSEATSESSENDQHGTDALETDLQAHDIQETEALYESIQTLEIAQDDEDAADSDSQDENEFSERKSDVVVLPDVELLAGVEGRALSIEERFRRKQEQAFNTRNIRFLLCGVIPLAIAALLAWQWYAAREAPVYEADTATELETTAAATDGALMVGAVNGAEKEVALATLESARGDVNSELLAKQRSEADLLSAANVSTSSKSNAVTKDTEVIVKRKSVRTNIANLLSEAFASFSRGDLDAATVNYESVLAEQAGNVDALNGLGAIAMSKRQDSESIKYFNRALSTDPTNAYAMAMLKKLEAMNSSHATRVDSILSSGYVSSSGEDYFVLGHAYAAEGDWGLAQDMFFQAYSLDKSNSTYAYHLAVSLEHLGKSDLALPYYQFALENSESATKAFDRETIRQRLDLITPG